MTDIHEVTTAPAITAAASSAPPAPRPAAGPLSPGHYEQLAAARRLAGPVRRAAAVATFNGWSFAAFAALCLPFALFDLWSLAVGAGLAAVACNELRGAARLRRFDPAAPRALGWGQVALLGGLCLYAALRIVAALTLPGQYDHYIRQDPALRDVLGSIDELHRTLTLAVYGALILGSLLMQGLNAWYYFTRGRAIAAYLRDTPAWIVALDRAPRSPVA